jgi:beta-1,4-mannosyltransferase
MKVVYFPFRPQLNPFQELFASALITNGVDLVRVAPMKILPLQRVMTRQADIYQFDWPHDWFAGRSDASQWVKRIAYLNAMPTLRSRTCVWTMHNTTSHDGRDPAYERQMVQALINACRGIIVLSDAGKEILHKEYHVPITCLVRVIPHGHFIDAYPNTISKADARSNLSLPQHGRVVLSFGRVAPYKGHIELINAFTATAQRGDILLIAGKPVDTQFAQFLQAKAGLASAAGPTVRLDFRAIPSEEVQNYFNACDLVALPFDAILNSGSLLLAMSFGRCVVAPHLGSIPSIVLPEGWFQYRPGDPEDLKSAIATGLADQNLQFRGQKVLEFTKLRYNWTSIGASLKMFYSDLLIGDGV